MCFNTCVQDKLSLLIIKTFFSFYLQFYIKPPTFKGTSIFFAAVET